MAYSEETKKLLERYYNLKNKMNDLKLQSHKVRRDFQSAKTDLLDDMIGGMWEELLLFNESFTNIIKKGVDRETFDKQIVSLESVAKDKEV